MAQLILDGVESIRVIRADGNLKITGTDAREASIDASYSPEVRREAGVAEVAIRSNATIAVPAGVAIEVEEVAGNLDASDLSTPLSLGRVRGNLHVRRIGSIAVRDTVSGNFHAKHAGLVEGQTVRGLLAVENARAVTFSTVSGDLDCREIEGEVAVQKISGTARLRSIRGRFLTQLVGGNLEVEDAAEIEAGVIGGKLRGSNLTGTIKAGKIGGKLALDGVNGDVAVGFVGGNARIAKVAGALTLEEVGGAIELSGPTPTGKSWSVRSRGRVNLEVDANSSLELDASAGWGRIRTHGVAAEGLKWIGPNHLQGTIGPEPKEGARTKLTVETRGADVIVATADARERDFFGRNYRARVERAFGTPFEDLASELGEDVPAFVRTVLDAAGRFVSESGGLSGDIVRDVTRDVKRNVARGLREVERAIGEIEGSVPEAVGEKLTKLGKEIADLVAQAVRGGTREARDEIRDRVREAAREMRDTIRKAARGGDRGRDEAAETAKNAEHPADKKGSAAEGATQKLNREDAILEILAAVKEGRLQPEEAEDLISTWIEVRDAAAHR